MFRKDFVIIVIILLLLPLGKGYTFHNIFSNHRDKNDFEKIDEIDSDFDIGKTGSVEIKITAGTIEIERTDENISSVHIVEKVAKGLSKSRKKKIRENFPLILEQKRKDSFQIKCTSNDKKFSQNKKSNWKKFLHTDVTLKIPAGTDLNIESGIGHISISQISGDFTIENGIGNVTLDDCSGKTNIDIGIGNIDFTPSTENSNSEVEIGIGDLRIHSKPDVSLSCSADVGIGKIKYDIPELKVGHYVMDGEEILKIGKGRTDCSMDIEIGIGSIKIMK